jgi:hypothetical protein
LELKLVLKSKVEATAKRYKLYKLAGLCKNENDDGLYCNFAVTMLQLPSLD